MNLRKKDIKNIIYRYQSKVLSFYAELINKMKYSKEPQGETKDFGLKPFVLFS